MTTTVCITGYKYEELDQQAKDRVGQWLNDGEEPWEDDKEYWLEQLAALGYDGVDFRYSGFYSQGDGASIACGVDVLQFIKRHKLSNQYRSLLYWLKKEEGTHYVRIVRARFPHYVHQYMIDANADDMIYDLETIPQIHDYEVAANRPANGWTLNRPAPVGGYVPPLDHLAIQQANKVADAILEEVREWSMKIYRSLQEQWEYQFTDEYMIDMCDANEYLFDKMGKPIHHLKIAA